MPSCRGKGGEGKKREWTKERSNLKTFSQVRLWVAGSSIWNRKNWANDIGKSKGGRKKVSTTTVLKKREERMDTESPRDYVEYRLGTTGQIYGGAARVLLKKNQGGGGQMKQ